MPKTAGILLIGNEILSGKVADANAVYLCRELRRLGVDVRRLVVIPDEVEPIAREVAAQSRAYDYVFTSGGVGPTHDDVTIDGVARAMRVPVVREPRLADLLNDLLQKYPDLLLGSYPEFSNPAYKVKVTLESRDQEYVSRALEDFLARLPRASVVRVE